MSNSKNKSISRDIVERLLASQCPDIDIRSLVHKSTGWANDVWRCNNTLLRFPLHEEEQVTSQMGALLTHQDERLDVQLPQCTYIGRPTAECQAGFACYHWINGESLLLLDLSTNERESW